MSQAFKRFLGARSEEVLAYTGGSHVRSATRKLALAAAPKDSGWYRFEIRGRKAHVLGPAEAPDLERLPLLRGCNWQGRLVQADGSVRALAIQGEDESLLFAPLRVRRWHEGSLVLEGEDFETEIEQILRNALEARAGLAQVRGVSAAQRAAYVYALLERVARRRPLWQPPEVRARIPSLAEGGEQAARAELRRLEARRAEARATTLSVAPAPTRAETARASARGVPHEQATRVRGALTSAGASYLSMRALAHGTQLAVQFRFLDGRFESIVASDTLNVIDAGICLDGADRALTLESLPGVIREAVETGQLVVTRRF